MCAKAIEAKTCNLEIFPFKLNNWIAARSPKKTRSWPFNKNYLRVLICAIWYVKTFQIPELSIELKGLRGHVSISKTFLCIKSDQSNFYLYCNQFHYATLLFKNTLSSPDLISINEVHGRNALTCNFKSSIKMSVFRGKVIISLLIISNFLGRSWRWTSSTAKTARSTSTNWGHEEQYSQSSLDSRSQSSM